MIVLLWIFLFGILPLFTIWAFGAGLWFVGIIGFLVITLIMTAGSTNQ